MPVLRDTILKLMPRRWREEAERDSRLWKTTCKTCGHASNIWDLGGMRWKAAGNPTRALRCPTCARMTLHQLAKG
jgi:hypothetical protein